MGSSERFLEALSLLPGVARVRQHAMRAWGDNVPVQLDFALAGVQIANHLVSYTDDERAYMRGVLAYGLAHASNDLRAMVLRPLISTIFERARRIGPAYEQAVLLHLQMVADWKHATETHEEMPRDDADLRQHPPDIFPDEPHHHAPLHAYALPTQPPRPVHFVHDAPPPDGSYPPPRRR